MKNSFTLLITIFLLSVFSYLAISILQTKSLRNTNLQNQYLYLQANNHKEFLKQYLNKIELKNLTYLEVKDDMFEIYANIKEISKSYEIDIFIKAKEFDIDKEPIKAVVKGRDLVALGINPSIEFKEILSFAFDLQLDEDKKKDEIIEKIRKKYLNNYFLSDYLK